MKRFLFLMAISICLSLSSGCKTRPQASFNIQKRQITIITEPSGAVVTQLNLPGEQSTNLGITPIEDRSVIVITDITAMKNMPYTKTQELMKRVGNVVVNIRKDGYKPYHGTLKTEEGRTAIHKIILDRQ
jgi:hypothetical protein